MMFTKSESANDTTAKVVAVPKIEVAEASQSDNDPAPEDETLDARRPRFLREIVGNAHIVERLGPQMERESNPKRILLYGPTGTGKTTIARVVARKHFCEQREGIRDICGICDSCVKGLGDNRFDYNEMSGAWLADNWGWFEEYCSHLLYPEDCCFFLDEVQDLPARKQAYFLKERQRRSSLPQLICPSCLMH